MPVLSSEENGAAPALAVFTIFIILSCALAISSFQNSDQRSVSATQQLVAADVTRATASAIEGELNRALATAVTAAMYDAGNAGKDNNVVKQLTLEYLNRRISQGWSYPNLDVIIPQISAEDLAFEWQPDGSVEVRGYIDAEIRHICGPTAHGVKLETSVNPRFLRLQKVALHVLDENSGTLEFDRYAAEGLDVKLHENNSHLTAVVTDIFASPCAMVGSSMDFIRYIASKEITLSTPPATPPPPSPAPSPSQPPPPQPSGDFVLSVSPSSGAVAREFGPTQTGTKKFSIPIPSMSWEVVGSHLEPVYGWVIRYSQISIPIYGWVTRYFTIYIPPLGYVQVPYQSWEVVNHLVVNIPYPSWEQVGTRTVYDYDWVLRWSNFTFDVPIYENGYPSRSTGATVTVIPIGGYSQDVSLSLEVPDGLSASLGSSSLKPNPHQVSTPLTVEAQMSKDPMTGTYLVTVVGQGADGKIREASYTLEVKDSVVQETNMEPVTITPMPSAGFTILPVYDGGDTGKALEAIFSGQPLIGGYVNPGQFPSSPLIPGNMPGVVNLRTGKAEPLLSGDLSEILLNQPDKGKK